MSNTLQVERIKSGNVSKVISQYNAPLSITIIFIQVTENRCIGTEAPAHCEGKGGTGLPSFSLGLGLCSEVGRGRGSLIRKLAGPGPRAGSRHPPLSNPGWRRAGPGACLRPIRFAAVRASKGGWRPGQEAPLWGGAGPTGPAPATEYPKGGPAAAGTGTRPIWHGSERVCGPPRVTQRVRADRGHRHTTLPPLPGRTVPLSLNRSDLRGRLGSLKRKVGGWVAVPCAGR